MSNEYTNQEHLYNDADSFEDVATETLKRVQEAFVQLIAAVPGPTDRPSEIQKTLNLHKTLAWKVSKIIESTDMAGVYSRLPGQAAVVKILSSARSTGVPQPRIEAVQSALTELDKFVNKHAGHRDTLESILSQLSSEDASVADLGYRKDGFRATSHVFGIQARTIVRSVIAYPSQTKDMLDTAILFGAVDFMRLRSDRPWRINRWRPTDNDGQPIPVNLQPIEPDKSGLTPLLKKFCSKPLPTVRRRIEDDQAISDEVAAGRIGTPGAISYFSGEYIPELMHSYRTDDDGIFAQNLELRTPCRTVVFDHLVHRDLFGRVSPQLRVFGELAGRPLYSTLRSNVDQLEIFDRVEYLGCGPNAMCSSNVPRYPQMISYICDKMNWSVDELDVYRLRLEYPYVPTTITLNYPLPERSK
ncbi:MAG: hypothetical protein MK116_07340 [Phycisphaerales bacterium]|nr:hypothetical protein [Phycisphaerales bacterium]